VRREGRLRLWISLAVAGLLAPSLTEAHLVQTGFGPFYDGISHLALTPDDLLSVAALALLAGLCGARAGRLVLFALPGAWLAGGVVGLLRPVIDSSPLVTTVSFLVVGAMVALGRPLPAALIAAIAAAFGFVHGFLNGATMGRVGLGVLGLTGVVAAVFTLVALLAAFVVSRRRPWERVAVRVAGSWITAVGLLMLGWLFRGSA
jgi:hydrogenase/urease accessory protein HupE